METIVVGIDVSKNKRDIAVRPSKDVFSMSRDAQGLDAVIARLAPLSPVAVAVEATGGFETVVAASLAAAGLPVVVVNPAQVRAFAQALGKRAKTDPIDACVIAHFAAATRSAPVGRVKAASRESGSAQALALTRPAGADNTSISRSPLTNKTVAEERSSGARLEGWATARSPLAVRDTPFRRSSG